MIDHKGPGAPRLRVGALMAGGSAAALLLAAPVFAQDTGAAPAPTTQQGQVPVTAGTKAADTNGLANAKTATVNEIVVTGSRIRGVAPVGSTVIGVGRDDITATGAVNITQALQDVPQILNLGVSEDSRSTGGGAGNITYASGINIRGIGPYATLTLLDGRRLVQAGASGGIPDPSNIPVIGLERAEIVPDGASAIYGSDAIAGVANLILRRNFDGVEAMVREGTADSYNESQVDVLAGHKWDGGQFTAALEHSYHSALNGSNRSFYGADLTGRGGNDFRSSNCNPANIVVNGVSYAGPGYAPNTQNLCDIFKNEDLIPQQERTNFDFTFNQDLGHYVSMFAEGIAAKRNFTFHTAPATSTLNVPSSNAFYTLPAGVAAGSETVETGFGGLAPPQGSSGQETLYELTGGFDVRLPHDFKFETDYTYGQDTAYSISTTGINNGTLGAALASGNPATALDPYGARSSAQAIGNVFNSLFFAPGNNVEQEVEAKIDGPLFHLPGGDVRIALGGEYNHTSLYTGFTGGTLNAPQPDRVKATQEVKAAYGELFIPIVGADNALPFVRSLTLDVAGRYEDYTNLGSTTNPKVGLNWSPVEGLTLHGSYGTSFRAPLPSQVTGAINGLFVQPYATPNGVVQGVALSGVQGGNPLTPETATTYSAGADYTPPFYRNLKLSVNYFNIDYEKQITSYLSDLTLLSSPARAAEFSSIILSGAAAQAEVNKLIAQGYPVLGALPSSVNTFVFGENFNLGSTKADGFDFSINWRQPTEKYGAFTVGLNGTYFMDYLVQVTPTAPVLSEANRIFNPLRLRMRGSVGWSAGPASLTAFVNFENSYLNDTVTPVQKVDAYTTVDLHAAFALDRAFHSPWLTHTSVMVDVTNLFDTDPPFVNVAESSNGGGGFDPTVASPIGRLVSVAIDKRF